MHQDTRLLSRSDAAALLRDRFNLSCSKQTLANWAHEGRGPAYHLVGGRALYPEADLLAWVRRQLGLRFPRRTAAQSVLSITP